MRSFHLGVGFATLAIVMMACSGSDSGTDSSDPTADSGTFGADAAAPTSDAGASPSPTTETFTVGGTVTGLTGTGLVLQNNGGDDVAIGKDGSFTFPKKLAKGASFKVTVKTQPTAPAQTCTVSGDSGVVATGAVTSVVVNCATNKFTVGGTVTGLAGAGLVLQNNGGADLVVNANGSFAFTTPLDAGATYAVTVKAQPGTPSQTCAVTNGTGTVASANVTSVTVTCTTNKYTVGGTVAGLAGSGLKLKINGGETVAVPASGPFTFPTSINSGATYAVTVDTQPSAPNQTCAVTGGTGTVGAANVTSVAVNCTTNKYTVGGNATGVSGTGLVLQDNGGDDLAVNASGGFAFATPLESGSAYAVTIKTQPSNPWQTCALTNAAGNVVAANVTNVGLACTTNTYKLSATVSGVAGTGLVVSNGADDVPVAADGSFDFPTPVASGATYNVTVKTQPTGPSQTCAVTKGAGKFTNADIADVTIACTTNKYTVGGSVTGVVGTGLVLHNGADDLAITKDGAFTFPTSVLSGGTYNVSVKTQPSGPTQTCTVSAGSGNVTNGNVVTVAVNCTTNKYTIGGTVGGMSGNGLVLQNNLGNDLTVNGNGTFSFSTPIASGATYSVTVKTQPTGQGTICTVTNGSGTVGAANVTNVNVQCGSHGTFGPTHTFAGMSSTHYITQGACSLGQGTAADAAYFCQHFYNNAACTPQNGYVLAQTPNASDVKMHKFGGCTSQGTDIAGTTCQGGPCKIGNWLESTNGLTNLVCVCP